MAHLANGTYWSTIGQLLRDADTVVYEGLRPSKALPESGAVSSETDESSNGSELSYQLRYRRALAQLTGWRTQASWANGSKDENWKRGDLDLSEFISLVGAKPDADAGKYWRATLSGLEGLIRGETVDEITPEQAKGLLRRRFTTDVEMGILHGNIQLPERFRAAQLSRERRALEVLGDLMSQKHQQCIAIIYGAAHTPRLTKAIIKEFALEPDEEAWIDATVAVFPGPS